MQVDNTTPVGFINNTIKQKRSKEIDIRFYWIRDCTRQGEFKIYWAPRSTNLGDYHTKHHSPSHHRLMRPQFLHDDPHVQLASIVIMHILQGCVNSRKMRAVRAEPDINSRKHITDVRCLLLIMSGSARARIFGELTHPHRRCMTTRLASWTCCLSWRN